MRWAVALWVSSLLASGCGPAAIGAGGGRQSCGDEERVTLDCSSEVSYEGLAGEVEAGILDVARAEAEFEETAIRRVNEHVERYVAVQGRACRDYNACILDKAQYRKIAARTRERIAKLPALLQALDSADGSRERLRALDAMYREVVPEKERSEEITFSMGMVAEIPEALGGGTYAVAPDGAIPTGAQIHFEVRASADAYLYLFQTTPRGEITVLYPDLRIGTENPLPGGFETRIPPKLTFRVNERDLGTEQVYVVVSRTPRDELDSALSSVKRGEVERVGDHQLLSSVARVEPHDEAEDCPARRLLSLTAAQTGCARPRAMVVEASDVSSRSLESLQVRTQPGDDVIVTVYPFEHLSAAAYRKAGGPSAQTRSTSLEP